MIEVYCMIQYFYFFFINVFSKSMYDNKTTIKLYTLNFCNWQVFPLCILSIYYWLFQPALNIIAFTYLNRNSINKKWHKSVHCCTYLRSTVRTPHLNECVRIYCVYLHINNSGLTLLNTQAYWYISVHSGRTATEFETGSHFNYLDTYIREME